MIIDSMPEDRRFLTVDALASIEDFIGPIAAASGKTIENLYAEKGFDPIEFQFEPIAAEVSRDQLAGTVIDALTSGYMPEPSGKNNFARYAAIGAAAMGLALAGAGMAQQAHAQDQEEIMTGIWKGMALSYGKNPAWNGTEALYEDSGDFPGMLIENPFAPGNYTKVPEPLVKGDYWKNFNFTYNLAGSNIGRDNATGMYILAELEEARANATMQDILGVHPSDAQPGYTPTNFTGFMSRAERLGDMPLKEAERALDMAKALYGGLYGQEWDD
jgi:hypothetical protein